MKQPSKLSRNQKEIVSNNYLNANEYMFIEDLGAYLKIIHKETNKIKIITKFPKKSKRG